MTSTFISRIASVLCFEAGRSRRNEGAAVAALHPRAAHGCRRAHQTYYSCLTRTTRLVVFLLNKIGMPTHSKSAPRPNSIAPPAPWADTSAQIFLCTAPAHSSAFSRCTSGAGRGRSLCDLLLPSPETPLRVTVMCRGFDYSLCGSSSHRAKHARFGRNLMYL